MQFVLPLASNAEYKISKFATCSFIPQQNWKERERKIHIFYALKMLFKKMPHTNQIQANAQANMHRFIS